MDFSCFWMSERGMGVGLLDVLGDGDIKTTTIWCGEYRLAFS
jgi:hypothetical protein